MLRVQFGVLDAGLAHDAGGASLTISRDRQVEVFADHAALLGNGRRVGERLTGEYGPGLSVDPRVADAAARHGNAVDAGLGQHASDIFGSEEVAAAEDGLVARVALDAFDELPVAAAGVALFDRAAMHGDGGQAGLEGRIEDAKEVLLALGGVIHAAPQLKRNRDRSRDGVAHAFDDLDRRDRVGEQETAAATPQHLPDRAAEVDVDHVEAGLGHHDGGGGQRARLGAHQLPADRVILVLERESLFLKLAGPDDELIEHHLVYAVRRSVAAGDQAHRRVAVAGQGGLNDREIELQIANPEHAFRLYCPNSKFTHEEQMSTQKEQPNRIHLIAHANPGTKDVKRFRFADTQAYLRFIREHLPAPCRLTCTPRLFDALEDQERGGRRDDAARIRDVQNALDDANTLAIVAAAGGAYFSRILPHLDFSPLARRRTPLWTLGFSEMTNFVNLVASYRGGRGLYWLCPNYLGWQIRPLSRARAAFAEFWQTLPHLLEGKRPTGAKHLPFTNIKGKLARGAARSGSIRLVGGCLSVLVAMLAGPLGRRLEHDGYWLAIEDLQEPPYRIDRHLATLKLAGWFERVAGVLVGAFHNNDADQRAAVLELLKYHLPPKRRVPVVTTNSFGHVWPMMPLELNRRLKMTVSGRRVSIGV